MNISKNLQIAIDTLIDGKGSNEIRNHVIDICERYVKESGKGKRLVKSSEEAIAYAVSRMPATYASIYCALNYMREIYDGEISTLLDFGSGTGAVSWVVNELLQIEHIICVEREKGMIDTAQQLMQYGENDIHNIRWIQDSVISDIQVEPCDLVTASYVMNELSDYEKSKFLDNIWKHSSDVILIVEPGTMMGYHNILEARDYFIERGANVIAPCPHNKECSLEKEDWCHFACRVQRSKIQKYVKNGDAPYEDEKYSYIIVSKKNQERTKIERILRHPIINKGFASLRVCSEKGIQEIKISARDKQQYKSIRKAQWGDIVILDEPDG